MTKRVITSTVHRDFLVRASLPGTTSHCSSGSSRFLIYPTGKITRCFGRSDAISHLDDCSIDFVERFRAHPGCTRVTCVDPCDLNWTDKRSIRESDEVIFAQDVPWTGGLGDSERYDERKPFALSMFQINITPTLLCNYACSYCIAGSHMVDKAKAAQIQIDPSKLIALLNKLFERYDPAQGMVIFLSGGEPFLWSGLEEFSGWCARSSRVSLKVNTNGSRADDVCRLIDVYAREGALKRIFIQLSAHVHEPQFNQARLSALCKHLAESGISYSVAMVGDQSGQLSAAQQSILSTLSGHPTKIYYNFLPESVESHVFPLMEGH